MLTTNIRCVTLDVHAKHCRRCWCPTPSADDNVTNDFAVRRLVLTTIALLTTDLGLQEQMCLRHAHRAALWLIAACQIINDASPAELMIEVHKWKV